MVIGASNGSLWAFDGPTGATLPNFPLPILDGLGNKVGIRSSAALVDLDNDGGLDMILGDQLGRLHGYDASGDPLPGFPIQTGNLIQGGPAVGDVDSDGLNEVVVQSFDQRIYCWDTPWAATGGDGWPMFKANALNSGIQGDASPAVTGVGDDLPPLLMRSVPNPARGTVAIRYAVPETSGRHPVRLSIYTVSGRLVRELVRDEQAPGVYTVDWDLTDGAGRRLAAGIYPYRLHVGDRTLNRKLVVLP